MAQVGRLNGKVTVVTGAAGGIGEAICERFLAEGANVMMVDCHLENLKVVHGKLNASYEGKVAMIRCDVTEENSACEAFTAANKQFKQNCNVLVNCAGIPGMSPIVEASLAFFNKVLSVNLKGAFTFTREFLRRLELGEKKDTTGASIVNIASIAANTGFENLSAYGASKAGLVAFTKTTCIEVGKYGVRCNALTPGAIDTAFISDTQKVQFETLKAMIPMRRLGKPIEVANACLFLASDESSYINGATLQVSGGSMA